MRYQKQKVHVLLCPPLPPQPALEQVAHPVTGGDIEDGQEGQPDNAGGVHGKADELGLLKFSGTLRVLKARAAER